MRGGIGGDRGPSRPRDGGHGGSAVRRVGPDGDGVTPRGTTPRARRRDSRARGAGGSIVSVRAHQGGLRGPRRVPQPRRRDSRGLVTQRTPRASSRGKVAKIATRRDRLRRRRAAPPRRPGPSPGEPRGGFGRGRPWIHALVAIVDADDGSSREKRVRGVYSFRRRPVHARDARGDGGGRRGGEGNKRRTTPNTESSRRTRRREVRARRSVCSR